MKYEESAELRTNITGWVCKKCGRFWGNGPSAEHLARGCCATDRPCVCGNRVIGRYAYRCYECLKQSSMNRNKEVFEKSEPVEYDGSFMIDGNFYNDVVEYLEWCYDQGFTPCEWIYVPNVSRLVPSLDSVMENITENSELEDWDAHDELHGQAELAAAWEKFEKLNEKQLVYFEGTRKRFSIKKEIEEFECQPNFEGWV